MAEELEEPEELKEEYKESSEDTMFQDAIEALRRGNKPRAKELLTLLIKADQSNPTYWVWLSASMETAKERIYCLQAALKLDPESGAAKRGLILLGALTPDESVPPFPLNRPRAWENKLLLASEKPRERGFRAIAKSPAVRLVGILALVVALGAAAVFGFIMPRQTTETFANTNTPGPSPTFTTTPTLLGAVGGPTKASGATPLWMMLPQTYTPTPLYVNTPRAGQAIDQYRSAKVAYAKGDWDAFIANMELIIPLEPRAADVRYLIGEAYRFKGDATKAANAYNAALKIDPNFGAPYLGLARARLMDDPNAKVESLFDDAIKRDPNFGEIYLERARYFVFHNDPKSAITDLDHASQLMPSSPEVYLGYANAYMALDDKKNALKAAEKAYSLDITALPVYKLLGELYMDEGQYQRAIDALDLYVVYRDKDDLSLALLGQAYFELKNYKASLENFNKAMEINPAGLRKFRVYRGFVNLELKNVDQAVADLEIALEEDGKSFDVNLWLLRAYYLQGKFGSALLRLDALKSLAETDQQKALEIYWHALIQEKRNQPKDAVKAWQELMAMDKSAMTLEMRAEAESHLKAAATPTNTPKRGATTPTPKGGTGTPTPKNGTTTPTPKGGATATPTGGTLTPAPKSSTITLTPKVSGSVTATPTLKTESTPLRSPTPTMIPISTRTPTPTRTP